MAWNVHARQIRLAELLARRQFIVTAEADAAEAGDAQVVREETRKAANGGPAPPVFIEGPDTVVTGERARYRVRPPGSCTAVSWAVGGGSVSQSPDPVYPDELLLIADRPGDLTIIVRAREGMLERRATKAVTAVADVTAADPPVTLRLFLQAWGLVVVAVLVVGFTGALVALGSLAAADFIALAAPMAALLAVVAVVRGTDDAPRRPAHGRAAATPRPLPAPEHDGRGSPAPRQPLQNSAVGTSALAAASSLPVQLPESGRNYRCPVTQVAGQCRRRCSGGAECGGCQR
jgi:hypothetical protein